MHQHTRRKVDKAAATVWLLCEHAADAQGRLPQQQRIIKLQLQRLQQRRFYPNLAWLGRLRAALVWLRGLPVGVVTHAQTAPQRVARTHCLERNQPPRTTLGLLGARHRRESLCTRTAQTQRPCLACKHSGQRLVATHHHIAAKQLRRIALQSASQPIGKKRDRRQRSHCQQHRNHQQAQLARPHIAPQSAPAQTQKTAARGFQKFCPKTKYAMHTLANQASRCLTQTVYRQKHCLAACCNKRLHQRRRWSFAQLQQPQRTLHRWINRGRHYG